MKRNLLFFAVMLLALPLLLVAVPVMAVPTSGQKVPASILTTGIGPETTGSVRITDGDTVHIRDNTVVYYNSLTIGTTEYNLYSYNFEDGNGNMKTGEVVLHYDAIWYVPDVGSEDGFTAYVYAKVYDFNPVTGAYSSITVHTVGHGFGNFEGQTLMLSYDGPPGGAWTGYCLKG